MKPTALLASAVLGLTTLPAGAQPRSPNPTPAPDATPTPPAARPRLVEVVVATVGDKPVWLSELRHAAGPLLAQITARHVTERARQRSQVLKGVLDEMVIQILLQSEGERLRLGATKAEVDRAMSTIAQQNNVSVAKLMEVAAKEGFNEATYREVLRQQIIEGKLVQLELRASPPPSGGRSLSEQDLVELRKRLIQRLRTQTPVRLRVKL